MKTKKLLLLCVVLLALKNDLFAQSQWKNYVSDSEIKTIIPNGNDLIIVGKCYGMTDFNPANGNKTFYLPFNSAIPTSNVYDITLSGSTRWLATDAGLVKYDGTDFTIYNKSNSGIPSNNLRAITKGNGNDIWIGTSDSGMAKYDGTNWTVFNKTNSSLITNQISDLIFDDTNNTLWVANENSPSEGGLFKVVGTTFTKYNSSTAIPFGDLDHPVQLTKDASGNIWVATSSFGLTKFVPGTGITTNYNSTNSTLPYNNLYSITIDGGGNIWVGSLQSWSTSITYLSKFNGTTFTNYNSNTYPYSSSVVALFADNSGTIWFGANGLIKFDGTTFTKMESANSEISGTSIRGISMDTTKKIWIATEYGTKLDIFNGTNWSHKDSSNSLIPYNFVGYSVFVDSKNKTWTAGEYRTGTAFKNSTFRFDGLNWTEFNKSTSDSLPSYAFNKFSEDKNGNIWAGTYNSGVAKYNGTNWIKFDKTNGMLRNSTSGITTAPDGKIWVAHNGGWDGVGYSNGGISIYDGTSWTKMDSSNSSLPAGGARGIAFGINGKIWVAIGTYLKGTTSVGGGLAYFDGTNWTVYNTSNSQLPSMNAGAVAVGTDNVWVGTDKGLVKINGTNWTIYDNTNSDLLDNNISQILIKPSGEKWIVNRCGATVLDDGEDIGTVTALRDFKDENNLQVIIYPNPSGSSSVLRIKNINQGTMNYEIDICDLLGKVIHHQTLNANQEKLNLNLSNGIYLYKIYNEKQNLANGKIVIK